MRCPSSQTVSEWADANRVLDSSASSEPGPWRTSRVPYMREVMDVLSPSHPAQRIVLQKSARIAGTEAALNNPIGCYMEQAPCPIMVVQPSEADAEEWSKDSLDPMLASTPSLAGLVTSDRAKAKGNTILHKRYLGGVIYVVGASTPKSFRRRTARVVLMDEIDAYAGSLGGEGDPVDLAATRTVTYPWSRKIALCSTPTIAGASRIEVAYQASDRRRYLVPCPECRHMQRLVWGQVHWADGKPESAEYACIGCGALIPHHRKPWMLDEANGAHWEAENPGASTIGFHISALYSPWVTWAKLAEEWTETRGDPAREQVFCNTALGETWDAKNAEKWDDESLRALLEPLPVVPAKASCVTAGVDVQGDRLVYQADAWGPHEERWTLERRDLRGDPSAPDVWADLSTALLTAYPVEGGGVVRVKAACVDTGGQHTQAAWNFCKRRHKSNVWGVKGSSKGSGQRIWPRESKYRQRGGYAPIMLGVHDAKSVLHARLRRSADMAKAGKRGGAGFWHFSDRLPEDYFEELTSEVCVVEYGRASRGAPRGERKSRWVLRAAGIRNEALDISVYSYAALCGLLAVGAVKLDRPMRPSPASSAKKPTAPPAPINPNPTTSGELDTSPKMPTRSNREGITAPRPMRRKKAPNYM